MDQNPNNPTSNDPFNYDPIILDDELHQLVNSVVQPTPQTDDVYSAIFSENNQQPPQDQYTTTLMPNVRNLSVDTSHDHQPIPPHEHVNNVGASSKGKGKGKKISNARDVERQRRQEMSSLYHDLRSLLPDEYVKGKRSKSDLVQETINYINNLQIGIEELNETKNKLSRTVKKRSAASRSSSSSNNNTNNAQQKYNVTVKPCNEGYIEVIVHTNATHENDHDHDNDNDDDEDSSNRSLALSKVLRKLSEEGLDVLNFVSSRIDETLVHTIQAQIEDGREIDLGLLQQKLMFHY